MFASKPIMEDEVVVIWGGKFFVDKEGAQKSENSGKKIQQIDEGAIYCVPAGTLGRCRYVSEW